MSGLLRRASTDQLQSDANRCIHLIRFDSRQLWYQFRDDEDDDAVVMQWFDFGVKNVS